MKSSLYRRFLLPLLLLLVVVVIVLFYTTTVQKMNTSPLALNHEITASNVDLTLDYGAKWFAETRTYWGAPIMWDGMFDGNLFDQAHREAQSTVTLTVFAVGRYLDTYLHPFLLSAEKHFMIGLPVRYYVFTDQPEKVPQIQLGPQRKLHVIAVTKYPRWQDISMMRMGIISHYIESEIRHHSKYVFCLDVDLVFKDRFGSEALGDSVAQLHSSFYNGRKDRYDYDKNPKSKAYMEKGDYYYHACVFGGRWQNVKNLTHTCYLNTLEDTKAGVEALWQDESYLNKYFWLNKPSKVLSPEYCSYGSLFYRDISVLRLMWAPQRYKKWIKF